MASNPFSAGLGKAVGETNGPAPIKQAPMGGVRQGGGNTLGGSSAPPFQPQMPTSGLDEFGRNSGGWAAGQKNPLAAVGDFNQRRANASAMMPPAAPSAPQATPYGQTGGGFMYPSPPQQDPPQFGGGRMPPQQFPQQRGPMPYAPEGSFGAGAGQGMFRGQQQQQPQMGGPQADQAGGPMQPPPGFQKMMQQPGFMQWLMKMWQGQQQGGQQGPGAQAGMPQQQAGPMTQGPPR